MTMLAFDFTDKRHVDGPKICVSGWSILVEFLLVVLWISWKVIFPASQTIVSAGCTITLVSGLYYVSPAGITFLLQTIGFCWFSYGSVGSYSFPARLVSAGCTMVLLVVIFPAARLVSAGCTMVLLEVIVPAGLFVPAVYMVLAVCYSFLLH
ncbi:hypothetical protein Tco_1577400 [Tanacetum coccineum]